MQKEKKKMHIVSCVLECESEREREREREREERISFGNSLDSMRAC
jgi:hypothetical protein